MTQPPWKPDVDHTAKSEVVLVDSLAFAQTSPPPSPQAGVEANSGDPKASSRQDPVLSTEQVARAASPAAMLSPLDVPLEAPPVLAGFLVSYDANPLGQFWAIHQGHNLVGRVGAGADADIEFPHATVSSRHAVVVATALPGRMLLTDHGSTNGTFVNDVALQPDQHWPLNDGDTVRFGLFSATVKIVH